MTVKPCVATLATQPAAPIGHNGGPDWEARRLFHLVGPRVTEITPLFECGAPWTEQATDEKLKRLAVLQRRISFKEQTLEKARAERKKIMNRCIRRMRRSDGKN